MCYRMRRFEKIAEEKANHKEKRELNFTVDDESEMLAETSRIKKGPRRLAK